jgi:hypothetical protein
MTDAKDSRQPGWGKAVRVHLGIVGLSFVLSFLLLPVIVPFDPEGAGMAAAIIGGLLCHGTAAIFCLCIPRASIGSCALVFCIAFLFRGCLSVEAIKHAIHLRYYAVYDRYRDHLASPVPMSVSNLRFVSLEEQITPELMFRFDIDPADLDAILKRLKMERVNPKSMLNPKDFFQYPYYMPLDGKYHVFQGKDEVDRVLTIKTNESHTHVIFRMESSGTYRDRTWENRSSIQTQMINEGLERMKREYEAAHGDGGNG